MRENLRQRTSTRENLRLGRLGAGVTISIDAVPGVFITGLLQQHPICRKLFNLGRGLQGHSAQRDVAAATAAWSEKAVQQVYERFETACDDLDSGLFDADDLHCYCCMQFFDGAGGSQSCEVDGHVWCRACSYQVHGWRGNGGQHREFATTARPNNRCSGCAGCSYRGEILAQVFTCMRGPGRAAGGAGEGVFGPARSPPPPPPAPLPRPH